MTAKYLAHISKDGREQPLIDHLEETAELAKSFSDTFGCPDWGHGIGYMHDIGKYSEEFQKRLRGGPKVDHSTAGAKELVNLHNWPAAFCVSGHHGGIPEGGPVTATGTLKNRVNKSDIPDYAAYKEELTLPRFYEPSLKWNGLYGFNMAFFIRMLYSCLVDADYLNTETFMLDKEREKDHDNITQLYEALSKDILPWLSEKGETINGHRTRILNDCLNAAKNDRGLFTLTAPTGSGKTISSLAFALRHAVENGMRRIIYIIPYTSIVEQNAEVIRNKLGYKNVLEHHCNVDYGEEEILRLASENYDIPIIITTNVQFFESLYSNKPSKCRKLHNIANSVLIFDEAQMLPFNYLLPCTRAISELIINYKCSAVLCTATQPAVTDKFLPEIADNVKEICSDPEKEREFFKRTTFEDIGEITQKRLTRLIDNQKQALCILNTKKTVREIYENFDGEGVYHLSTFMVPADRKKTLAEIRDKLKKNEKCIVISTSLVEAGVDLDFPIVFRELAGLDSIIQSGGRCNREGKRSKDESKTLIFTLSDRDIWSLPIRTQQLISATKHTMKKYSDFTSADAIREYFKEAYLLAGTLDAKNIVDRFEKESRTLDFPFATISQEFKLIEEDTKTIFIPLNEEMREIKELILKDEATNAIMRKTSEYSVSVYKKDYETLLNNGDLILISEDFAILENLSTYDEKKGLVY